MKALLKFNLPEDNMEHLLAVNASKIAMQTWDFLHNSHREYKHDDKISEDFYEGYRKAQEKLLDMLLEEGIDLDKLIV